VDEPSVHAGRADGPSAAARGKAVAAAAAPPAESGGGLGTCLLWVAIVSIGLFGVGFMLWALNAPLPWSLIGLGPPKHELTMATWEEATLDKTVFVKFFAPWCGHCKRMKPDWEKLVKEYSNSSTVAVAAVDCIGAGKSLCTLAGVKGFPAIKYGDPSDIQGMEDYKGQRTYKSLSSFAAKLGPLCGPARLEHCNEEQKARIVEFTAMTPQERQALIDDKVGAIQEREASFKTLTDGITQQYKEASAEKEKKQRTVKEPLDMLRAVHKLMDASKEAIAAEGGGGDGNRKDAEL